mmetsp:Transcript_58869/g.80352  ORF Transcript_58869/g.80352 Transcript_58869/m.80352 type:complete len:438 (-) Transcript_58869:146-1459(-)
MKTLLTAPLPCFTSRLFLSSRVAHRPYTSPPNSDRSSVLLELDDRPGALNHVLKYFWKYDINITQLQSRPSKGDKNSFEFFVDFEPDPKINEELMGFLREESRNVLVLDKRSSPWFPRHISDLDAIANRVLYAGTDLESDHPGFQDSVYRSRRKNLAQKAMDHRQENSLPYIDYSAEEKYTWGVVYDKLVSGCLNDFACEEYLRILPLMESQCGYSRDTIPQQEDISAFLRHQTRFQLRPVAGLLSSRDFLNALAFRVFFCTQYIRHHSVPLYTPEPDICHELLGHAPMFADPDFADFSQEIGLASLGASDEDVQKLARCYWHSVEFGLVRSGDGFKAYGAGLLSSFGELEYACAPYRPAGGEHDTPLYRDWDPEDAATQDFPITTYQPLYFVADSLHSAKEKMRGYCESLQRPFFARYDENNEVIWVDRAIKRELA